ncbi:UDP-N-acetylmuramoyl-tripeptide--D-alanyl-D-alanine ligase [Thermithiobacillus tepidarius DSM 3134]|uniref:UDP-N-acetylmuramoyl-tripeptide--D-alanyl-D- alanine ligase n=1 Tax=Thermithiobacillus tepidarius TaxID=929 RepID=UPI00056E468F|nr:UDP-N-acetylmuramoyl-tripeptide--D-alanyl-D-alanine ligase [Thermithiobacillus tepidarius]
MAEVARITGGKLLGADVRVESVGTDSRTVELGMLFVALQGPRFDGHAYLADVAARGGAGALVSRAQSEITLPQVVVPDTLTALQTLATAWRSRFAIPVVAVTGSCGKTTVKEMTTRILAGVGPTLATRGNLNNHIGVPLTLLRLRPEHRFAVIEMGMNHAGELAQLTRLARPDVAVINNARPAHLEGLGSVAAIAAAKGEILEGLSEAGVAVLNGDDDFVEQWAARSPGRVLRFGLDAAQLDVRGTWQAHSAGGELLVEAAQGRFPLEIPLPGRHNGANALAAATVGLALGLSPAQIAAGLAQMPSLPGRLQWREGRDGSRVLDDTYNANPASLEAAMQVLAGGNGFKVLVLGNMGELGPEAAALHAAAGQTARALGIDRLLALGDLAAHAAHTFGEGGAAYPDLEGLLAALRPLLNENARVLVKGSRSARMERVVQEITTKGTN